MKTFLEAVRGALLVMAWTVVTAALAGVFAAVLLSTAVATIVQALTPPV